MAERYLDGRVAMVTGGASGMGRAMALEFAKAGANVAIGSLLSNKKETKADGELVNMPGMEEMERTKGELEAHGVKAITVELDVTSTESCENFYWESVKAFGKVDILANAAGITAEHGVTANAICPGWTETTFGTAWLGDIAEKQMNMKGEEFIAQQKAGNPQGRLIQPSEIGALAAFLCKDEAMGITGQDLTVSADSLW